MSDNILEGFEHQINEKAEDITPYYMQHVPTEYPDSQAEYNTLTYYEPDTDTTYLLELVVIFLATLIFICTIIMVVLCVKLCCQNQASLGMQQLSNTVPPPFIYVTPFIPQYSQAQNDQQNRNVINMPNHHPIQSQ